MKKRLIVILTILIVIGLAFGIYLKKRADYLNETASYILGSDTEEVKVLNKDQEETTLIRGREVQVKIHRDSEIDGVEYREFVFEEETYYGLPEIFCEKAEDCVYEKSVYVQTPQELRLPGSAEILGRLRAKEELEVLGYSGMREDGSVEAYLVKAAGQEVLMKNDDTHVRREFVDLSYDPNRYDSVSMNGGAASTAAYYPKDKNFTPKTLMPEVVKSLYINAGTIGSVDDYMAIASMSGINAFVIDIKDTNILSYRSPVVEKYAPSSAPCVNDFETYQSVVKKLHDNGYYTIGRITVFKDPAFAADHPETVILQNGDFYRYNGSYWPSIFSREVWEYNVSLAKEAVEMCGFDEIQFDYVRSPEVVPQGADMHNEYGETRVEAITGFIRYAADVLHEAGAYVSIDVFGETSGGYVTAYGQYWPTISNAADVISAMPYPDHFSEGSYGLPQPWKQPYELMYYWGSDAAARQKETYEPARVRTWIQVYDSIVDGTPYDASMVAAQIRGLTDAGVLDGYITWNAAASVARYDNVRSAFN